MSTTHVPLQRVHVAREVGKGKSSRRRFLGTAAASVLAVGALRLPKAQPAGAQARGFVNTSLIQINDNSNASPYASPILVTGMVGNLIDLTVSIFGLHHTRPEDIEMMLVNPTSVGKVIMAGVGGAFQVSGARITVNDSAAGFMPDNTLLTTGNYKPTNHLETIGPPPSAGTSFGNPAPQPALGQDFNIFRGLAGNDINGAWRLFVKDNATNEAGVITGGWGIVIVTDAVDLIIRNDSYVVNAGETLKVNRGHGVLRNDRDPNGGRLHLSKPVRKSSRIGHLLVKRDGSLTFVARNNVAGRMNVNYIVVSSNGLTGRGRITIIVRNPDPEPEPRRRRRRRR